MDIALHGKSSPSDSPFAERQSRELAFLTSPFGIIKRMIFTFDFISLAISVQVCNHQQNLHHIILLGYPLLNITDCDGV